MELKDWNMDVLDTLLKYRDIERDTFDFKGGELSKLEKDVCAMANTITGVLCLGIKDPASHSPTDLFIKDGFRSGTEDKTINSIYNFVVKVDPVPTVTHKVLDDQNAKQFYVLLKVEGSASQRPYMIKDTGQIFVRIGSSSRPASRTTIANLFINILERRNNILKLQSHCRLLRNELLLTAAEIKKVKEDYLGIISQLDLNAFKDAVLSAEWFLRDQNLLGEVRSSDSTSGGLYTNIQELNILNTTIDILNREQMNRPARYQMSKAVLDKWKNDQNWFNGIISFLDDIVIRCDNFLQSNN
jgi:hypothetical protein